LNEGPEIPPEQLDTDAVRVVTRLKQHGFEAYLVGGCVRDLLLGRAPKDFDIATSAHPEQVKELFRNSRLIGRRFRLAQVYFKGGKILEVSTFRKNPTELLDEAGAPAVAEPDTSLDLSTEVALQTIEGEDVSVAPLAVTNGGSNGASGHDEPVEAAPTGPDPAEAEEAIGGGVPDDDVFITQDNVFGSALEDARRRDFTINGSKSSRAALRRGCSKRRSG
jgi:tRNA nucleotidyltransferase/poly(A) polymerase